jgi:ubiquinone/menaquinone biosynthesis C-methylase UbiE
MGPDQQQGLQLLSQPAQLGYTPAAEPAAQAITQAKLPTSQASALNAHFSPPDIGRGAIVSKIFGVAISSGIELGMKCGAAYGAVCGLLGIGGGPLVLLTVPIGAIIGAIVGCVGGVLLGLIEGLVLGIVSATCFYPLRSWTPYRDTMGVISVLVAVVPLIAHVLYDINGDYGERFLTVMLVWLPLVISCICACFASGRVAESYAAQMRVAPNSLPFNFQTVDIYDPTFQELLFERLQPSYETVAQIASLGMLDRWRRRLVELMDLTPDARVCDLMSGSGALWDELLPRLGPQGCVIGIERSPAVVQAGRADLQTLADPHVELRLGDALSGGLPDRSVSAVTCAFGPMLVPPLQIGILADEIARILDDHGVVGLVDMSLPSSRPLRWTYLLYLGRIVPLVAFVCRGDPNLYRTLARFVERSSAIQQLEYQLAQRGFQLFHYRFTGGFATALVGMKIWKSHNH